MKKQGFTLIETVVAMTILATILVSGAQLLSTLFTAHITNQDKVTATYLAQECLEITRNNRDTNWLQNKFWNSNLEEGIETEYDIFTRTLSFENTSTIVIDGETVPTETLITCTVDWTNETGDQTLSLSHILTNWRKK